MSPDLAAVIFLALVVALVVEIVLARLWDDA